MWMRKQSYTRHVSRQSYVSGIHPVDSSMFALSTTTPVRCRGYRTPIDGVLSSVMFPPWFLFGEFIFCCPVWMPQALKPLGLIQFWSLQNGTFPLLALWGNKNWLPSMKVKKLEKFQNKMGLKGCKWSSLNAPGTQTPLSHLYWKLQEFPFYHY